MHGCSKRNISSRNSTNHCIVRHDAVTARAISRLSHGVAQLNASPNSTSSRSLSRGRRSKNAEKHETDSSKCRSRFPFAGHKDDGRFYSEELKKTATGSKRKWQSEKHTDAVMDVDQSINQLLTHSTEPCVSGYAQCSTVSNSLDHSMCSDHYSSCSSMLSLSASSDNDASNTSSDENEADAEDNDDGDRSRTSKHLTSSRSCIDIFGKTPTSPSDSGSAPFNRRTSALLLIPNVPPCGGDSSDGLSVNIKIPRLASSATLSMNAFKRISRRTCGKNSRHTSESSTVSIEPCAQACLSISGKEKKSHSSGGISGSSNSSHAIRQQSNHAACARVSSIHDSSTSISNSLSPDGSPSLALNPVSPESCEDLANDEQSDFPADESLSMHRLNCRSSLTRLNSSRAAKPASHYRREWSTQSTSSSGCSVPKNIPHLPHEVDSELEDILTGTWPLLSHRAKLGYIRGMNESGSRNSSSSYPNRKVHSHAQIEGPDVRSIEFVPSKLGHLETENVQMVEVDEQCGAHPHGRMPTPPWLCGDDDVANVVCPNEDCFAPSPDSSARYARSSDPAVPRPGLGFAQTHSSSAIPIPTSNIGHQILQKLGWEPGKGLGTDSSGLLDPVGCTTFHFNSSSQSRS